MWTIVFVTPVPDDDAALALFNLRKQLGIDGIDVRITSANNLTSFIYQNRLNEATTLFLDIGLCEAPGISGVVLATSAKSGDGYTNYADADFARSVERKLTDDPVWTNLPIDYRRQNLLADAVFRMWTGTLPLDAVAPETIEWATKTAFFTDVKNPQIDTYLAAEIEEAVLHTGKYDYNERPPWYKLVHSGCIVTITGREDTDVLPAHVGGYDRTAGFMYFYLKTMGFHHYFSVKAARQSGRLYAIEDRCLSVSAAIVAAKQWLERMKILPKNPPRNPPTVISGNMIGNVMSIGGNSMTPFVPGLPFVIIQNAGTIVQSDNSIANFIGNIHRT